MSVTVDIVGYRDKAEGNKLIQDADALLNLRASLNEGNSRANNDYIMRQKFNIPPVSKPTLTAEEELRDTSLQRQKALTSLKTVMKEPDALRSLDLLATGDEINEFNRYSSIFLKEIAGQSDITPTYFETLWDRYKNKLIATGNTGIAITTEPGEYTAELADLDKKLDVITTNTATAASAASATLVGKTIFSDAVDLAGMDNKALDAEFDAAMADKFGRPPVSGDVITIPRKTGKNERKQIRAGRSGVWEIYGTKNYGPFESKKCWYILSIRHPGALFPFIEWTGDPTTVKLPAALAGTGMRTVTKQQVEQKTKTPFNHFAIYGAGLENCGPSEQEPKLKIDEHVPKRESLVPNQKNFGNYSLSLNSLKKGFLYVRYPSGAAIPHFPKVMISSRFRRIINDLIYEDRFVEEDYTGLDDTEKKLFDDLITLCKLDKKDNVKIYRHKKYSDKDRDEIIKRFNILKGELLAGNDNPNLVKELKLLVIKMQNDKIISKTESNKLIYQLCMTI